MGRKSENPHFLGTDELWSTYGDTFEKPSGRATRPQNFVGQSSKTAEIWRWGENRKNPTFSKLTNFGPLMVTLLQSPRAGLHDTKNLWTKVQKRRRYGDGGKNRKTPTFSKLTNFGPLMVTLLESPQAGLHDTKNLWTKVQKGPRYR